MYYINDIQVGDSVIHVVEITEELHQQFCQISGDNSPIHTDLSFCTKAGFDKPIGYAFLLTSILSKIYGTIFPGGSELCLSQECKFRTPFFVGDKLTYCIEVKQKNTSMKLITLATKITNQDNHIVFTGEAVMQLVLGDE